MAQSTKNANRMARHARVRKKISGTADRPRLNVYKSNMNMYAQIIDDEAGVTLVSASTLDKDVETKGSSVESAGRNQGLDLYRRSAPGHERS